MPMNAYACTQLAASVAAGHPSAIAASRILTDLIHDDAGQDVIEYALIAAFIGLGTVSGVNGLAAHISNYLNIVDSAFNNSIINH